MTENNFKDGVAMLPQKRIQWIDVAKLIGIYLVILGHINMNCNELTVFIFSFHMPLFFFLSGLTAKKESVSTSFKKSIKSLIIPYVCLYLVNYLYLVVNSYLRHPEKLEEVGLLKPLLGMFVGVGYETEISTNICVPLWFLAGLFCCKMLFSLIHNIFSGKNENIVQIALSVLFVVSAYLLKINHLFIPFSLGSAFMAYPFFVIGNLFSPRINSLLTNDSNNSPKTLFVAVMIIALISTIVLSSINGRVDVNGMRFGRNVFLFYINAVVGIVFMVVLSNYIKLNKVLNIFAQNTIIILAFHGITTGLLVAPFKKLGMIDVVDEKAILPVTLAVFIALGSLLLNYVPIYIINRFCPWMLGRKRKQ